jgi:6-phosphogluconolactonase
MELVHAPVAELKGLLTQSFEDWAEEGRSCALSGGNTALIFLPALREASVEWSKITFFWADERAVDPEDPESNYGLAERMLLSPLGARAPRAMRMPIDSLGSSSRAALAQGRPQSLGDAAVLYDKILERELNGRPLDLAILGIGEDGHICSLFPGHKALLVDDLRAVAVEDAPKMPRRRLSLTLRFVLQTRKIWLVVVGSRKVNVLHAALSKKQRATPLDLLIQQARDVTVFTDQVIRSAALHSRPYG